MERVPHDPRRRTHVTIDCMACLGTGLVLPMGVELDGIVHFVRWAVGSRERGCYLLCDFETEERLRTGSRRIDIRDIETIEKA